MKCLLAGNGINIQFDSVNYTTQQIVLRILKNCDREDFPKHIIVNLPYLLKIYIGKLFLVAREVLNGNYECYAITTAERSSIKSFQEQYSSRIKSLRIPDIGFEDYYLLHDLVCHKYGIKNPDQFGIREALRFAYLFSIYNDGKLNRLHELYPAKFIQYLNGFDSIFTTNYDSNIDSVVSNEVYHIHGQFDKLAPVYDPKSFRNQLPDSPIANYNVDLNFSYLYSNALSTYCGEYKQFQIKQNPLANEAVEKFATTYLNDPKIKMEIDNWTKDKNSLVANMGYAIQLKAQQRDLTFPDDYHFDKLSQISDSLEILGLSPWNDFHIFETIDQSNIKSCVFYFYSNDQCQKVIDLLPNLQNQGHLHFSPVQEFWRNVI